MREKIREIVADVLEAEPADESSFADDFEADSLLVIEIFSRFERDLGIKIPQDELTELDDLPTAYALVEKRVAAEDVRG
ncbi:phosphopantetheine-binding protein [Streptomyces sp. NPDC023723]|uniref:acyl carrier protein n=1 Tax=Streptomyces sp. NPDC023723 TaxID=3154323 RepID=UPI0033F295A3